MRERMIKPATSYSDIVEQVNNRVENLCVGMNQEVDSITFKMNLRLFLEELEDEVMEHHRMLWEDQINPLPNYHLPTKEL